MIEKIIIKNFKSLVDVSISLDRFSCFVGMNGAGKSTLLQAIDFISQQMHGYLYSWLDARGWESKDLYSRTGNSRSAHQVIFLGISYRLANGKTLLNWEGSFNRTLMRLTKENIWINDKNEPLLEVADGKYKLQGQQYPIAFDYTGSLLSQLKDNLLPEPLREFRDSIRNIRSLELLSPHLLRKRSRTQDKDIGAGGEKLSGFLDQLSPDEKENLLHLLQRFYPRLKGFRIAKVKGGGSVLRCRSIQYDGWPFPGQRNDI